MSNWRHNSSSYWNNQGQGNPPQYPDTINEEELEDGEDHTNTGEEHTYALTPVDQQQVYWTDEPHDIQRDQYGYAPADQQPGQPLPDYGQEDVTYTPRSYTGASMDVNFSVTPSEHEEDDSQQAPMSPPPADAGPVDADSAADNWTQHFVDQRRDSYDRHDEFRTAPATAFIRRSVETIQRINEAEAPARQRGSGSRSGAAASGSGRRTSGSGGSRAGGKSSSKKGSGKGGGRS